MMIYTVKFSVAGDLSQHLGNILQVIVNADDVEAAKVAAENDVIEMFRSYNVIANRRDLTAYAVFEGDVTRG